MIKKIILCLILISLFGCYASDSVEVSPTPSSEVYTKDDKIKIYEMRIKILTNDIILQEDLIKTRLEENKSVKDLEKYLDELKAEKEYAEKELEKLKK